MPRPARARLMAEVTSATASSCPNTTRCSDSSSVRSRSLSDEEAWRAGMFAIRATTCSISATSTGSTAIAGSAPSGTACAGRLGLRAGRLHPHHRARLVHQVDGAVGQAVVAQVPRRKFRCGLDGGGGVGDLMMLLVALLEPLQDAHGLFDGRFLQRDLLEAARQRAVLLDLLVLVERRRSHDAETAASQDGLEQRRQVHRAAGCCPGADDAVELVDEQDGVLALAAAQPGPP